MNKRRMNSPHVRPERRLLAALALSALALAAPAHAQAPDAQAMIEALKPQVLEAEPGAGIGRTRGLRNLRVEAAGASDAAAAAQAVAPSPRMLSLTIGFEFDSATITPASADTLASLAQALQSSDLQALSFRIEGHTDARGKADYNLRLSRLRAEAVKARLEKLGVAGMRLVSEGRGNTEPANAADPLAAENRRVRIVTLER